MKRAFSRIDINWSAAALILVLSSFSAHAQSLEEAKEAANKSLYRKENMILEKLAIDGNPTAAVRLAVNYAYGWVKDKSPTSVFYEDEGQYANAALAEKWFLIAAEAGEPLAMSYLGEMYSGKQVGRLKDHARNNYKKSKEFYTRALIINNARADNGNCEAQYQMFASYAHGLGVLEDYVEAIKWLKKSAKCPYAHSQSVLSQAYLDGVFGMTRNPLKAYMWTLIILSQSSDGSYLLTGEAIKEKAKGELSQNQLVEAQSLAKKCIATNYAQCD